MKSFYKECEVEMTAVYVLPAKERLTPRVEIHCENITKQHLLTTKKLSSLPEKLSCSARRWRGNGLMRMLNDETHPRVH
jgi:hypothetical protein